MTTIFGGVLCFHPKKVQAVHYFHHAFKFAVHAPHHVYTGHGHPYH